MPPVDDKLVEGDAPSLERDIAMESFQPVTVEADGDRVDSKGVADDAW